MLRAAKPEAYSLLHEGWDFVSVEDQRKPLETLRKIQENDERLAKEGYKLGDEDDRSMEKQ